MLSGRSPGSWIAALLVYALCASVGSSVASAQESADDEIRWSALLRMGLEYDDNPHRLQRHEGPGDGLARYYLGADVVSDAGQSGQVSVSLRHGGKFFRHQRDANAMLTEVRGSGRLQATPGVYAQVLGDVKDRSETTSRQDYTRGGTALRLGASPGPFGVSIDGGWRFFAFKPSPTSSWTGPQLRLGAQWRLRGDLAADVSWTRSWRSHQSTAWELRDERFVPVGADVYRNDQYNLWRLALRYQRRINARLRYQHLRNRSNSYGQRLRRHSIEASLTAPLVWETFGSLRAELQRTRYEDPVYIDDAFRLDEDNRNVFVAALNRELSGPWQVELRYSLFAQEFGIGDDYLRQTVALSIGAYLDES